MGAGENASDKDFVFSGIGWHRDLTEVRRIGKLLTEASGPGSVLREKHKYPKKTIAIECGILARLCYGLDPC